MHKKIFKTYSFVSLEIYIDSFNETIIDDEMNGIDYINLIISNTNGADPAEAWKKYAEEEIFKPDIIKNGSFYAMTPGLIDVRYSKFSTIYLYFNISISIYLYIYILII